MVDEEIEKKIESAPSLLNWEINVPFHTEKARILFTLFIFLVFFLILLGTSIYEFDWYIFVPCLFLTLLMPWVIYSVMFAEYLYSYKITEYGYFCSFYQQSPKVVHYISSFVMVVGGAVAILGFLLIGPKAFVGGGIFLLVGLVSGKKICGLQRRLFIKILKMMFNIFFLTLNVKIK